MIYTIRTETGKRAHNEDYGYVPTSPNTLPFIAVSDGMGSGEKAMAESREAIHLLFTNTIRLRCFSA